MVFAARYVNATKASGCLGKPGLTIDPLVPDTDVFEHEKRNAFPLEVPAGESRVVWVDVFVPADAPSGTVQGQVVVQHGALRERREERRNISLTILDFTLPSTPSMESLFGFGGAAASTLDWAGPGVKTSRQIRASGASQPGVSCRLASES